SSAGGYIRSGSLTALAHTAAERLPDYADLPTLKELGYPELVSTTWFSISAPANLPSEIAEKINRAIVIGLSTPEVQERFRRDGFLTEPMTIAEFDNFIAFETGRLRPVIERAGLVGIKLD